MMRAFPIFAAAAATLIATGTVSFAEVKKVPYTEVKVDVPETIKLDPALETMRKAFVDATAKKDVNALSALVGPTFVWLLQNSPHEQFDMGRNAVHNFRVAFGFREYGKDADGPVEDGPFWDKLTAFAADGSYYQDVGNLICGPLTASVQDDEVWDKAKAKIGADDSVEWYFTVADTSVAAAPGGTGAPVGKVGKVALPILDVHPPEAQGQPTTHLQVLLPSGKSGWIPISAARPFGADSLCYALTPSGEWKIAAFDQTE